MDITLEPPGGELGASLLRRYFDDLANRLPAGFDSRLAASASAEELTPPKGAFLVARLECQVVGCGGLRRLEGATAEVKHMWVAPEARRRGVGRALLSALEAEARRLGCATVRLDTSSYLPEALALYRAAGYYEVAAYNDNPYAHHWFEKPLG